MEVNCSNLIDLNLDDTNCNSNKAEGQLQVNFLQLSNCGKHNIENIPFDTQQNLGDRQDDIFDIVEKEAFLKASQFSNPPTEVRLGKLLSFSEDDVLDNMEKTDTKDVNTINFKTLDLESPPVVFYEKKNIDGESGSNTNRNQSYSAECRSSAMFKKNGADKKALLKLSVSHTAFSSPVTAKLIGNEDRTGTPVTANLYKAAEFGEHLLATESPLKFVDDENLILEEVGNFSDSDKHFEDDLEMLRIPMLNVLPSLNVEPASVTPAVDLLEVRDSLKNELTNIASFKSLLNAKNAERKNNHQHKITSLIENLRTLISSGDIINNTQKQQASVLLESLSTALATNEGFEDEKIRDSEAILEEPQVIKRQDSFVMELLEKEQAKFDVQPLVQEMPNCMVSSSATYDGETPVENKDLNLPEISPLSPNDSPSTSQHEDSSDWENHIKADVNDIMQQLSKILINSVGKSPNNSEPAFIVVMNPNKYAPSNTNLSNYLKNSVNDNSPDSTKRNFPPRRRSQSLSIHDKFKIIQMPMQQANTPYMEKQQIVQWNNTPENVSSLPSSGKNTSEPRTPARVIRRNSYSNGTPFTAQVSLRSTRCDIKNTTLTKKVQGHTHIEDEKQAIVKPIRMASHNLPIIKPSDLKKRFKYSAESIIKASGPLKATIPVKKVAPMLKESPPSKENNTMSNTFHNMSFQNRSKVSSKRQTTPLRTKRSSLGVEVGFPNACSTPTTSTSTLKYTSRSASKSRHSYSSVVDQKFPVIFNRSESVKRCITSELKLKSPLKQQINDNVDAASSSRASIRSPVLSTSLGPRFSKTHAKMSTIKTSTKPQNSFNSRVGSATSTKNKENKHP